MDHNHVPNGILITKLYNGFLHSWLDSGTFVASRHYFDTMEYQIHPHLCNMDCKDLFYKLHYTIQLLTLMYLHNLLDCHIVEESHLYLYTLWRVILARGSSTFVR